MNAEKSLKAEHQSEQVLLPALERLGIPFAIFGIVFLIATFAIIAIVTPDRFPVRIGDRTVRISDLEAEQKALLLKQSEFANRPSVINESKAPALTKAQSLAAGFVPTGQALLLIEGARASFKTSGSDPIALPGISITDSGAVIRLSGEVRDIGSRSTQILASFVDGLRAIPLVRSVSEPEYVQTLQPDGASLSPFSLTITLIHVVP